MGRTEIEAVKILQQNGIFVDRSEKIIDMLGQEGPGIKLWGVIDYLCHYNKYRWVRGF